MAKNKFLISVCLRAFKVRTKNDLQFKQVLGNYKFRIFFILSIPQQTLHVHHMFTLNNTSIQLTLYCSTESLCQFMHNASTHSVDILQLNAQLISLNKEKHKVKSTSTNKEVVYNLQVGKQQY